MNRETIEALADRLADAVFDRIAADKGPVKSNIREIILAGLAVDALRQEAGTVPASELPLADEQHKQVFARRFGRFMFSDGRIEAVSGENEALKQLAAAQEGCAVVRCERLYHAMAFEVIAYHPDFDECRPLVLAPEYDVVMETREDGSVRRSAFIKRE